MKSTVIPKQKPSAKEKVKEVLDIRDVAHAFSGAINERPRQPLILCPFPVSYTHLLHPVIGFRGFLQGLSGQERYLLPPAVVLILNRCV